MAMTNAELELALKTAINRLTNALANKTAPNSVKLDNKTLAEVAAYVLAGTAANSTLFEGKTYAQVVEALTGSGSGLAALTNDLNAFIARRDNPHQVTKAQVGLSDVENYGVATQAEADAGATNKYMTPATTKVLVSNAVDALINGAPGTLDTLKELADAFQGNPDIIQTLISDIASKETPAGAQTKVDAGVVAAKAYTDTGVADAKAYTDGQVVLTKAYADTVSGAAESAAKSFATTSIAAAVAALTKASVGLNLVENYGIAGKVEAEAGVQNDLYMTPLRVKEAIVAQGDVRFLGAAATAVNSALLQGMTVAQIVAQAQAGVDMSNLVQKTDDLGIYNVTGMGASQTLNSALAALKAADATNAANLATFIAAKATSAEVAAGLDDAKYVTSKGVVDTVNGAVTALVDGAPLALDTLKELAAALADDNDEIAALTLVVDGKLGKTETAVNSQLLEGKTKAEVIAEALAGKAATAGTADNALSLGGLVAASYATVSYVDTALQSMADLFNTAAAAIEAGNPAA